MSSIAASTKDAVVQLPVQPQTSFRKLPINCEPKLVCTTCGWNCNPISPSPFHIAAAGELVLVAAEQKPGGRRRTTSPWLIQTENSAGRFLNIAAGGSLMRST